MLRISLIFLIGFTLSTVNCEIYTSTDQLEQLLHVKAFIIQNLKDYINNQDRIREQIQKKIESYENTYNLAIANISAYIQNPINAYLLTKSLTNDWYHILDLMNESANKIHDNIDAKKKKFFPSNSDFRGAALALVTLQHVYKLNTSTLVKGEVMGTKANLNLSATDCFELGHRSYKEKHYDYTIEWMNETIKRNGQNNKELSNDARLFIAKSYNKKGNYTKAIEFVDNLLTLQPNNTELSDLKVLCQKNLEDEKVHPKEIEEKRSNPSEYDKYQADVYEKLCRKEIVPSASKLAPLRCKYVSPAPYLPFCSFKVEELNLEPNLLLYHDVIFDKEIEFLVNTSKPRLNRAGTGDDDDEPEYSDYRTSKLFWMKDSFDKRAEIIAKRVERMTGLNRIVAEELQVVNYGIGGQYKPHFDVSLSSNRSSDGERIATVLFYLTNVEEGGATVFPFLKTGVWPQKGTAVFWHNLFRSGEVDYRTLHAACPVLRGSKWVANKWLHEQHQEFLRPCLKEIDHSINDDLYAIGDLLFQD